MLAVLAAHARLKRATGFSRPIGYETDGTDGTNENKKSYPSHQFHASHYQRTLAMDFRDGTDMVRAS
jgi:hypothetical protein